MRSRSLRCRCCGTADAAPFRREHRFTTTPSMRILVVEDEHKLAEILRRWLEEQGHAVDVAHDGDLGLARAETSSYDLLILDVMLPRLSGIELCRQLRKKGESVPVLMLTARDTVEDRVAGLDGGADDYLVKPFAWPELLARVRALLRRHSPTRDPVLSAGDLELDTVSQQVRRAGTPVAFTSREYAVLEYLLRHPNQVLTRDQIAEHVWGLDFPAASNVIDVYMATLRRKLHDHREPRLLHTIRGAGYQLRVPPT